jgi:hypothetical protein|tara:strand:- start:355 stop:720 length:366 start_codon:yes stop_codon:yes gene_type:complete
MTGNQRKRWKGSRVETVSYTSEQKYETLREELMGINKKYGVNMKAPDSKVMPKNIKARREYLGARYVEMSRQRYLVRVPSEDRRILSMFVTAANINAYAVSSPVSARTTRLAIDSAKSKIA